jgi:hypothetical protein
LVERNIDASTGYTKMMDNIGEVENKGIEIKLDGIFVRSKDLTIGAGILFSSNKNQIVKLFGDVDGKGGEDDYPANRWFIGQPIDVFWDWVAIGIWQESEIDEIPNSVQPRNKPGSVKVRDDGLKFIGDSLVSDDNPDGVLALNDRDREIVSKMPKWLASFNFNASYKGFDLSMDVTTVQGIIRYNGYLADYKYGGDLRGKFNGMKVDYWTPENPTGNFPRPSSGSAPSNLGLLAKQDASFVKLTNISLGYTLPVKIVKMLNMNSVRIYCSGQNLLTFTEYSSYNPEQDPDDYPEAKTISFGAQISF